MRNVRLLLLIALLSLCAGAPLRAAPAQPAPCSAAEYRQFDFWLGDWDVTDPAGKPVGHNHVTQEYGGCVLQEHWTGIPSGAGSSFNIYDAKRKVWHQTWVDSTGGLLELEGGLKGGAMVLSGAQLQSDGSKILSRVTWTPKGGKVRQLWENSSDGGKTWTTNFDGIYSKAN